MKSLNIIGCGKVGKVIGRLFYESSLFKIGDILNRSLASAEEAVEFIGAGRAVASFSEMNKADLYLIASSDDAIARCTGELAASGLVHEGAIVFHLSGALASTALAAVKERGAVVASVHPVKSFANAAASVESFPGTWCGIEGDQAAVAILADAFSGVGGRTFTVDTDFKAIYHAGSVFVCNYLTALMETGLRCFEKGGLPREVAARVMEPLVRGTVDNIFQRGTAEALTGPIARGDAAAVARQLEAVEAWDEELGLIYRDLGRVALELAVRQYGAGAGFEQLGELLARKDHCQG